MKLSKPLIFVLLTIAFLFLSYDRLYHWDEVCYLREGLEKSDFRCFPENEHTIHVFIIGQLINLFGSGLSALFLIDLTYALIVIGFVAVNFLILKELFGEKKSFEMAVFLLFMPLTLYLSFKTVSEVLSIFFVSLGILFFLFSYSSKSNFIRMPFLIISGLFVFLSSNARIDGPIIFFSFLPGFFILLYLKHEKKFFLKYASHAIAAAFFFIMFLYIWTTFTGLNPYKIERQLVSDDWEGNPLLPSFSNLNLNNKAQQLFLIGSLFTLFLPFSLLNFRKKEFIFAVIWLSFSLLPPLLMLYWIEARYLYTILVPYSILAYLGFNKAINFLGRYKSLKWLIFFTVVAINLIFIPLMETQISGKIYPRLINRIDLEYPDNIILLANGHADYAFLKFIYPNRDFYVVQVNEIHQSADLTIEQKKKGFKEKFGNDYIADAEELKSYDKTKIFICYKRTKELDLITRLYRYALKKESTNEGVCAMSWVWNDPNINLDKIYQEGKYEVYKVTVK